MLIPSQVPPDLCSLKAIFNTPLITVTLKPWCCSLTWYWISSSRPDYFLNSNIAPCKGIRICGTLNPGLWNPDNSYRNPKLHEQLESRTQVSLTKNPESSIWKPVSDNIQLYSILHNAGYLFYVTVWHLLAGCIDNTDLELRITIGFSELRINRSIIAFSLLSNSNHWCRSYRRNRHWECNMVLP